MEILVTVIVLVFAIIGLLMWMVRKDEDAPCLLICDECGWKYGTTLHKKYARKECLSCGNKKLRVKVLDES